jgi:hypothetical protein
MNALQEEIHYSFIKFFTYCFSLRYEFFMHYALRVEKNYQHGLDAGPLEFQFLRPRGCLINPFRTLSLCFGVIGKTLGLISHNNFVKKFFVWIGLHDNDLAQCDSRSVEQTVHTTFSFLNPLSESKKLQSWGCSNILALFLMRFDGHFWLNKQQQQCLPQFGSILDGHLSSSTSSLPSRNREYHLKTFDRFKASLP